MKSIAITKYIFFWVLTIFAVSVGGSSQQHDVVIASNECCPDTSKVDSISSRETRMDRKLRMIEQKLREKKDVGTKKQQPPRR